MKRIKKLLVICIAFIGISLVATAAVNLFSPRAEFVSGTNNKEGAVYLVFNYVYADYLELVDCANNKTVWKSAVEYSYEEKLCAVALLDLSPGLYTFKVIARDLIMGEERPSDPFSVYVNAVEP